MADIKAQGNGNANVAGTWAGGIIPGIGDTAYSNGFTVTITANFTCALITNAAGGTVGAVAGGGFSVNIDGITVTANSTAGTAAAICLTWGGNSGNFIGNATGGSGNGARGIQITGQCNIVGNGFGGSSGTGQGIFYTTASANSVTGNVTGGAGGQGMANNTAGTINHTGNSFAGTGAVGSSNLGGGTLIQNGIAIAHINGFAGTSGAQSAGLTVVRGVEYASNGAVPLVGFVKFMNGTGGTSKVYKQDNSTVTLTDPSAGLGLNAGDLRFGVTIAGIPGTLKVPAPADVRRSVQTDNTVGTADLTVTDFLDAIQAAVHPMAVRLRNVSTVDSTGEQIETAING